MIAGGGRTFPPAAVAMLQDWFGAVGTVMGWERSLPPPRTLPTSSRNHREEESNGKAVSPAPQLWVSSVLHPIKPQSLHTDLDSFKSLYKRAILTFFLFGLLKNKTHPRDVKSHSCRQLFQQKFAELVWSIEVAKLYFLLHFQLCLHPEGSRRNTACLPL